MSNIIKYKKFGVEVSAIEHLKGKSKENCLCWLNCQFFKPNQPDNCEIAQLNFEFCKTHHVSNSVVECAKYVQTLGEQGQ